MDMDGWFPSLVSAGALGLIWFGIRTSNKKLADRQDQVEQAYLKEEKHVLLCEVQRLQIKEIFNKEMTSFKDDFFNELRTLKEEIKAAQKP